MPIARLPITAPLETRDGSAQKDSLLANAYVETDATGNPIVVKRPGLDARTAALGGGNAMYLYGDRIYFWGETLPYSFDVSYIRKYNGTYLFNFNTTNDDPFGLVFRGTKLSNLEQTQNQSAAPYKRWGAGDYYLTNNKILKIGESVFGDYYSLTSTDNGLTWIRGADIPIDLVPDVIVQGSGFLLATALAGSTNTIVKSIDDGVTWTVASVPGSYTSTDGVQLASDGNTITCGEYYTTDGITWTLCSNGSPVIGTNEYTALHYVNGLFYMLYRTGTSTFGYKTSTNGISWTTRTLPTTHLANVAPIIVPRTDESRVYMYIKTDFYTTLLYHTSNGTSWTLIGEVSSGVEGVIPFNFPTTWITSHYFPSGTSIYFKLDSISKYDNVFMCPLILNIPFIGGMPYLATSSDGLKWKLTKLQLDFFNTTPLSLPGV